MPATTLLRYSCILFGFIVAGSCQTPEIDNAGETYLDESMLDLNPPAGGADPTFNLGRVLFYDRQMSLNNTVACASCHKQAYAFADNQQFSRGYETRLTSRNSMPLQNLISFLSFKEGDPGFIDNSFNPAGSHFFWDGREQNLMSLVLQPVGNHVEMGIKDAESLKQKLSAQSYYPALFKKAFGDSEVTTDRISLAIVSFIGTMNSFNTRFDKYNMAKFNSFVEDTTDRAELTPLELEGMMLFQEKYDCNSCHQVQSPTGYISAGTFANIGLESNYSDPGLATVTGNPEDAGKFKIPSLRNVSYTAPYMHDGRFATLDEVIEHYSEGIADHPNLDEKLQDDAGNARGMNISEHEKQAIIAFMRTLDDETLIKSQALSNPFKVK